MQEQFREFTENAETFILEVIFEQRRGKLADFVRACLFGLSKVFEVIVKLRRFLYNVRILRDTTLGVQVIAIGNLTVGGTGKTPVVEKFARVLQDEGRQVAILSRGYRSKPPPLSSRLMNKLLFRDDRTPPRVVSDGKSLLLDSETAGDEPYMLASNLKDVVVLVAWRLLRLFVLFAPVVDWKLLPMAVANFFRKSALQAQKARLRSTLFLTPRPRDGEGSYCGCAG